MHLLESEITDDSSFFLEVDKEWHSNDDRHGKILFDRNAFLSCKIIIQYKYLATLFLSFK